MGKIPQDLNARMRRRGNDLSGNEELLELLELRSDG